MVCHAWDAELISTLRMKLALLALLLAACQAGTAAPTATSLPATPTPQEAQLLFGLRRDASVACAPLRTELPLRAIAGVECHPAAQGVERVSLYLFENERDLLETYLARLADHGLEPRSGICSDGNSEGGYLPGDGVTEALVGERESCFLDELGRAHYEATLPPFVLVGIDGTEADAAELLRWAWVGNQDQPGAPTIWRMSGPVDPEK